MALSRIKTWIAGEVLTASDLNAEYNNLLNNALTLISPLTGTLDIDGNTITLDAAAATQVVSSGAVSWDFTSGAKTGTPGTGGSVERFSAQTFTDSATAGSGTATAAVFYSIAAPTLAATNSSVTTTDAATYYIAGVPVAGTNETITNPWALWIDAGNVRFDDDIHWLSGQTFAQRGILAHAIEKGGSSISDYVNAQGERGWFQMEHRVYGREGAACVHCGEPVRKMLVAQRGTHYCGRCQKR